MNEVIHNQQLWINLFLIIGAVLLIFAIYGYIADKHLEKERKSKSKELRRLRKRKYQQECELFNETYLGLGKHYFGMDKFNAICSSCKFQKDYKCYCKIQPYIALDDSAALVSCDCYIKRM